MWPRFFLLFALILAFVALVWGLAGSTPARASATLTVTTTQDVLDGNDGLCSLREAVIAANTDTASGPAAGECPAGSGADTISFSVTGTVSILSPLTEVTSTLAIDGPGPDNLTLRANYNLGTPSLRFGGSGNSSSLSNLRVTGSGLPGGISIGTGAFTMTNVIVTGMGSPSALVISSSGARATIISSTISNNATPGGAGLYNIGGVLTVINSRVHNNGSGFSGAGVFNTGQATLLASSVYSNGIGGGFGNSFGAGIYNTGAMTVTNSTIARNQAVDLNGQGFGGGIYVSGTLTLLNTTVANNAANGGGGGVYVAGGLITIRNSILADSTAGGDCSLSNGTITDGGFNLVEDNSCAFTGGSDPLLGPLQDNGGPTWTHALLLGSPAIDAGNPTACTDFAGNPLMTDQRGFARPHNGRCDIGAFEFGASAPPALLRLFLPLVQR